MVMLVTDPYIEEQLIAERRAAGIDHHDEVWEGVYVVSPNPNNEHQALIRRLTTAFDVSVDMPGLGQSFPGANVSDRDTDWEQNYRIPDLAVFLAGNPAQNRETHWFGGPDFAIEVVSSGDRSRSKLDFYSTIGVRELLIIDRAPWALELYRLQRERLQFVGRSTIDEMLPLGSQVVPLTFRLVPGGARPRIEITHQDGVQHWLA